MFILNAFSFEVTGTEPVSYDPTQTREIGTVEATIGRETKRVNAVRYNDGRIVSWDFTGRYVTGKKAWPATVSLHGDRQWVWFGRDHHTMRCCKSHISFA